MVDSVLREERIVVVFFFLIAFIHVGFLVFTQTETDQTWLHRKQKRSSWENILL